MAAEEDSVARPDALGGGGGGGRGDCFEPSLLSASPEGADVWVRGRCSLIAYGVYAFARVVGCDRNIAADK